MAKTHDHPKSVKYPQPKEPELRTFDGTMVNVGVSGHLIPSGSITRIDTLAEAIYAHAVGAWIRDTCHRPSISEIDFEKIAKMAVHAAELFRRQQSQEFDACTKD